MPPEPASLDLDPPDLPDLYQGATSPPGGPNTACAHPLAPEPAWLDAMAMAMLSCTGGSGMLGWEGLGSGVSSGRDSRGSGGPLVRAAASFAAWGHSPSAEWVETMIEEVEGSSFLLSAGEILIEARSKRAPRPLYYLVVLGGGEGEPERGSNWIE